MAGTIHMTTVEGKTYKVWSDFIARATYAEDESGVKKSIREGGYLSNDLAIRKAIATRFNHKTFRK